MTLTITSPAFTHQAEIPSRHTCEGLDVSPALAWSGVPRGTQSLVLIVDDPDAPDPAAPRMTWVHWVLYNIPPTAVGLAEGVARDALPHGTLEGLTDYKRTGWGGPCPPMGRHRYFFKLYALDSVIAGAARQNKAMIEKGMTGHILEQAELVGAFQRRTINRERGTGDKTARSKK